MIDDYGLKQNIINLLFCSTSIKLNQDDHVSLIQDISGLLKCADMYKNNKSFSVSNILKKDFGLMSDIYFGNIVEEKYKEFVTCEIVGDNSFFIGNLPSHITEIDDPIIRNLIDEDGKSYAYLGLWAHYGEDYEKYNNTSIKNIKFMHSFQEAFNILAQDDDARNYFLLSYFPGTYGIPLVFQGVDYSGTFEFTDQTLTAEELKTIIKEQLNK